MQLKCLKSHATEVIDDCAMPLFEQSVDNAYDIPSCVVPILSPLYTRTV